MLTVERLAQNALTYSMHGLMVYISVYILPPIKVVSGTVDSC